MNIFAIGNSYYYNFLNSPILKNNLIYYSLNGFKKNLKYIKKTLFLAVFFKFSAMQENSTNGILGLGTEGRKKNEKKLIAACHPESSR